MPYLVIAGCLLAALLIVRIALGNIGSRTGVGMAQTTGMREIQADTGSFSWYGDEMLLLVADGIGSGEKGRAAAQVAINTVTRQFEAAGAGQNPVYFFRSAFQAANASVLRHIPDATAGACLLAAVIKGGLLHYALAGNCVLSVFRNGHIYPISEGQTINTLAKKAFRQKKITREEALEVMRERRAYNFIGRDGFRELEQDGTPVRLRHGDLILLFSDGVEEALAPKELMDLLRGGGSCEDKAVRLMRAIDHKRLKEQDNATAVIAKVRL